MPAVTITVLGSGTSMGVPTIGCDCKVCTSADPRDMRLRPSVLLSYEGRNVLIDTTPDFRQQALRNGIRKLDAIFYTHAHADHIMGLDDVRPISLKQRQPIPIYGSAETLAMVRRSFLYVFEAVSPESTLPKVQEVPLDEAGVDLWGLRFEPVPVNHGRATIWGYKFGNAAYITDQSGIPDSSMEQLRGLDVLFLDALRHKPHPTHSTVQQALAYVDALAPKRAYFTHISHDLPHEQTERGFPAHVRLAYDGLEIAVEAGR